MRYIITQVPWKNYRHHTLSYLYYLHPKNKKIVYLQWNVKIVVEVEAEKKNDQVLKQNRKEHCAETQSKRNKATKQKSEIVEEFV